MQSTTPAANQRATERTTVAFPARLTWKDQRGITRFASVVARNMSEFGMYVECPSPVAIAPFRLVQLQIERDTREAERLPAPLRQGRLMAAVYRVHTPNRSGPHGLALRLMVEPKRQKSTHHAADIHQTA
jgi:hypothetical protein